MREMVARALVAIAPVLGCGGGHTPKPDAGGPGGSGSLTPVYGQPAAMFTAQDLSIYRYVDVNGDGDYNEAGEQTLFYNQGTPSLGLALAIDATTVIAVGTSYTPSPAGTLYRLQDTNSNGNALDAGEVQVWWSGTVSGTNVGIIGATARGSDGAIYVVAAGNTGPQSIYRVVDQNGDGTANDPGEATLVTTLTNTSANQIAIDGYGTIWFAANATMTTSGDLYRVTGGTAAVALDHTTLASGAGIMLETDKIDTFADGSIVLPAVTSGVDAVDGSVFVALRDSNHDQQITVDEIVSIWSNAQSDYWCSEVDFHTIADGTVLCLSNEYVYRYTDGNKNGNFLDDGEEDAVWDKTFAKANGQTISSNAMTVAIGAPM